MNQAIDLNCDLGEWETALQTRALMRQITSANIACGGHAGDAGTMRRCLDFCAEFGVLPGAHPGLPGEKGRSDALPDAVGFRELLISQVNTLSALGMPLHHVKLHGSLYHATEREENFAELYLRTVREHWPGLIVYALAGGKVCALAPQFGVEVWPEAFADRDYLRDGSLRPRDELGASLPDAETANIRFASWLRTGLLTVRDGETFPLTARTWCIHSDHPAALEIATYLRSAFPAIS